MTKKDNIIFAKCGVIACVATSSIVGIVAPSVMVEHPLVVLAGMVSGLSLGYVGYYLMYGNCK